MVDAQAVEELQTRFAHWRKLRDGARDEWGEDDETTQFYESKLEECRALATQLGTSVDHLID